MMMATATAKMKPDSLPVIFFDGEQETQLGHVVVSPSLNYKGFQSLLSERIGISPHQFSIYLADLNRRGPRTPVTGKFDFAAVSSFADRPFFLVVLKRSRRERRRRTHHLLAAPPEAFQTRFDPRGGVMLLRRDGNNIAIRSGEFSGMELGRVGYERRIKELQMEKEKYLMNMGLDPDPDPDPGFEAPVSMATETTGRTVMVCEECEIAKKMGTHAGFHWCVYDTVTVGFKSPAGPIARPVEGSD